MHNPTADQNMGITEWETEVCFTLLINKTWPPNGSKCLSSPLHTGQAFPSLLQADPNATLRSDEHTQCVKVPGQTWHSRAALLEEGAGFGKRMGQCSHELEKCSGWGRNTNGSQRCGEMDSTYFVKYYILFRENMHPITHESHSAVYGYVSHKQLPEFYNAFRLFFKNIIKNIPEIATLLAKNMRANNTFTSTNYSFVKVSTQMYGGN